MVKAEEETLWMSLNETQRMGRLSPAARNLLSKAFGARFSNAVTAVETGRVRRIAFRPSNRTVWLVSGKEREYLVLSRAGFCSCEDFYFRVIGGEETLCYHLLAQRLAEALDKYIRVEENDDKYSEIVDPSATESEHQRKLAIKDTETVRLFAEEVLTDKSESSLANIQGALTEAGFPTFTKRHLSAVLAADKKRRFTSRKGVWRLTRGS